MDKGASGTVTDAPLSAGGGEALAEGLRLLQKAERTATELRSALLPRYGQAETEAALAWLVARRLLSDDRAAEAVVRPRIAGRRAEGDGKLRERLERRGASAEAIEKALSEAPDEAQRMQEALVAKFRPEDGQRAKAGRFLLSRGFDEEAVDGALDRFFHEG